MPIGSFSVYAEIMYETVIKQPKSVLDLGIGYGMNGAGVRNWIDLGYPPFDTKLIGVEVWGQYRSPLWDCYDVIHETTIENYLDQNTEKFDLIIMSDVIEHFEKDAGFDIIEKLKTKLHTEGVLLISTPAKKFHQGAVYGNKYERHLSAWQIQDFTNFTQLRDGCVDRFRHEMLLAKYVNK